MTHPVTLAIPQNQNQQQQHNNAITPTTSSDRSHILLQQHMSNSSSSVDSFHISKQQQASQEAYYFHNQQHEEEKVEEDDQDQHNNNHDNHNNNAYHPHHAFTSSSSLLLFSNSNNNNNNNNIEIQRLDDNTIRRISAEQAISDLCSIVKELIDNALDAESTTIKIRLFGQGLDIIEVSDDGTGIPISSRPFLATQYATSKINTIDDIYMGTGLTMGFRGEALFSMANTCEKLVVATRTEEEELATQLLYGRNGQLIISSGQQEHEQFPRKVGTTVAVVQPFAYLPARRADIHRRIKKERMKIFKLIEVYGIFNVGVCFQLIDIVENTTNGSKREDTALATSASSTTLQETISTILGSKFVKSMVPVNIPLDSVLHDQYGNNDYNWGIQGLISSEPSMQTAKTPTSSRGPNNNNNNNNGVNRCVQYYSINGRVVDLPKVTTMLRKLWSAVGGKKKPSIILSLTLPNEAFDINLSPDKQTVLLTHEQEVMAVIEQYVSDIWSNSSSGVFAMSQLPTTNTSSKRIEADITNVHDSEDEHDDDGERQMHKRRFAFVHDLSKAKMQHDLDGRQILNDQEQEGEERPSKKARTISNGTPPSMLENFQSVAQEDRDTPKETENPDETDDLFDDERSSTPQNFHKLSDSERQRWIQIQLKFQRKHSAHTDHELDILSTQMPVSPEEVSPPPSLKSAIDGSDHSQVMLPTGNVSQISEVAGSETTTEESIKNTPPPSRPLLSGLQQFAFQPTEASRNDIGLSKTISKNMYSNSISKRKADNENHPSNRNERNDTRPVEMAEASLPRSVPEPICDVGSSLSRKKTKEEDHNSVRSNVDAECDNEKPEKQMSSSAAEEAESPNEVSKDDHNESIPPVVWQNFQSTEQVCHSAIIERLNMIERKEKIDIIRKRVALQSKNSNPAMMISLTEGDYTEEVKCDVDKEVGFDSDDDDGESSSTPFIRISKNTFKGGMEVIGQFNLGFILARCSQNHLWILDQHACDEKYNFEQLCKNTAIHEQPLIKPLPLELSPAEEACVLDHMDIFQANGFRFAFDDNAPIRHRLSLTALPHSGAHEGRKAVQFGPSDVSTLCAILTEGSSYEAGAGGTGTDGSGMYGNNAVRRHANAANRTSGLSQNNYKSTNHDATNKKKNNADQILARLPKAIAMFASRACRTSLMIGTALSQREMETVVQKLAQVDMPWNCPHGRPTMRHVGNLLPILLKDEKRSAEHIATPTITVTPLSQPLPEQDGQE